VHGLFQYTLSGEGRFWDARGDHPLPAGTGFFCEPSDPATGYRYPAGTSVPWRFMYISVRGARDAVQELVRRFGGVYRVPLDAPIVRHLLAYERYDGSTVDLTPGEAMSLCAGVLGALADEGASAHRDSAHASLIREAKRLIAAHLEERFNVGDLAVRLAVSEAHLCRVFRRETGGTPLRHLLRERMRLACDLLQHSPLSIKEIGPRLGYGNPSHFTRAFRGVTGLSPREYRRQPTSVW
jgi:AraC-like DNA-binding protein